MSIPLGMYTVSNASPVGSDSNDGFDVFGLGSTGDTWTHATLTFTKATHGLTPGVGQIFYVSSASAGNAGWYTVASFTANTIVMTALVSGVDIGSDQTDIVTSTGAWLTLDKYTTTTVAGWKCWIKGGTDYVSDPTVAIDTAGTATTPNLIEGYGTTPGDNIKAVLDGNSDTSYGITLGSVGTVPLYYCFKNLELHSFTTDGVELSNADNTKWLNCRSHNNASQGFQGDRNHCFVRCEADNNGGSGWSFDTLSWQMLCCGHDNALWGTADVSSAGNMRYDCTFYQNGSGDILDASAVPGLVTNCTLDGNNDANSIGINHSGTLVHSFVFNTILYDHFQGYVAGRDIGELAHEDFNLFESNGTDRVVSSQVGANSVTGAPNFAAEGSDYKIDASSAAKAAGGDGGEIQDGVSYMDIGAFQRQEPAGGGGLIRHHGMTGNINA